MSSLLQFNGETDRYRGVRLEFVFRPDNLGWNEPSPDKVFCEECKCFHDTIYVAWRKPRGMFGPWVIFRYNGVNNVPDLSIPISVNKLPRDAKRLSKDETINRWHRG